MNTKYNILDVSLYWILEIYTKYFSTFIILLSIYFIFIFNIYILKNICTKFLNIAGLTNRYDNNFESIELKNKDLIEELKKIHNKFENISLRNNIVIEELKEEYYKKIETMELKNKIIIEELSEEYNKIIRTMDELDKLIRVHNLC
jgi:cell division protein FtsB